MGLINVVVNLHGENMEITTNQNTIRPNVPGYFTLCVDRFAEFRNLEIDVNARGRVVRIMDEEGNRVIFSTKEIEPLQPIITEILADIKKAFSWIAYCEQRLGGQLDDPYTALRQPVGHWCFADAKAATVVLRENRSMYDAAACGVTA